MNKLKPVLDAARNRYVRRNAVWIILILLLITPISAIYYRYRGDAENYHRMMGRLGTILFVLAITGIAFGIALWLTRDVKRKTRAEMFILDLRDQHEERLLDDYIRRARAPAKTQVGVWTYRGHSFSEEDIKSICDELINTGVLVGVNKDILEQMLKIRIDQTAETTG